MAHNNVVTWTCDRCGRKVEMDGAEAPSGWQAVMARSADSLAPNAPREWEVCGGCYSQVERLLMNQHQPEGNGTTVQQ